MNLATSSPSILPFLSASACDAKVNKATWLFSFIAFLSPALIAKPVLILFSKASTTFSKTSSAVADSPAFTPGTLTTTYSAGAFGSVLLFAIIEVILTPTSSAFFTKAVIKIVPILSKSSPLVSPTIAAATDSPCFSL